MTSPLYTEMQNTGYQINEINETINNKKTGAPQDPAELVGE
jgi:hypothetical protein